MSSFYERQKDLFNTLQRVEKECGYSKPSDAETRTPENHGAIDSHTYRKVKREMKQFRGRESIFKRPGVKMRDCLKPKAIPDHFVNPQKYDYYTLSDVTPAQMSDATNTATALAIIKDLELRDQNALDTKPFTDDDFKKPVFLPSTSLKKHSVTTEDKVIFKNSRVIMPEYVVGVSSKKTKKEKVKRNVKSTESKANLKLDHLYNDDDDCDE